VTQLGVCTPFSKVIQVALAIPLTLVCSSYKEYVVVQNIIGISLNDQQYLPRISLGILERNEGYTSYGFLINRQ
jgi:hypothetical protein